MSFLAGNGADQLCASSTERKLLLMLEADGIRQVGLVQDLWQTREVMA